MATQAEVNLCCALTLRRVFQVEPELRLVIVRQAIQVWKNQPARRLGIEAMLHQAYTDVVGVDPVPAGPHKHRFKHWLMEAGVPGDDAFEATSEVIT